MGPSMSAVGRWALGEQTLGPGSLTNMQSRRLSWAACWYVLTISSTAEGETGEPEAGASQINGLVWC